MQMNVTAGYQPAICIRRSVSVTDGAGCVDTSAPDSRKDGTYFAQLNAEDLQP